MKVKLKLMDKEFEKIDNIAEHLDFLSNQQYAHGNNKFAEILLNLSLELYQTNSSLNSKLNKRLDKILNGITESNEKIKYIVDNIK